MCICIISFWLWLSISTSRHMVVSRHVSNCKKSWQNGASADGGEYVGGKHIYGVLGTARCEIWLVL
jgi:hypothetical protein